MKIIKILFSFMVAINCVSAQVQKEDMCLKKNCFKQEKVFESKKLNLKNAIDYYYYFFHVYSIGLYLDDSIQNFNFQNFDFSKPISLSFYYHRDIEKKDLTETADIILEKNPKYDKKLFKSELENINKLYKSVREKDTYDLVYQPIAGTSLYYNGKLLGSVAGKDFAKFYFGIWLSQYSISKKLTNDLLQN